MSHFPKAEITGGPHGKNTVLTVDGQKVEKVHRVELTLDVRDVVRMTTFQFVDARVEIDTVPGGDMQFLAQIIVPAFLQKEGVDGEPIWIQSREPEVFYEGRGRTQKEALLAAIEQMP